MNLFLSVSGCEDDPKKSIKEFKRLSGKGNPRGWCFDRDEIHSRQDTGGSEDMQDRREIDGVRIVNPFG